MVTTSYIWGVLQSPVMSLYSTFAGEKSLSSTLAADRNCTTTTIVEPNPALDWESYKEDTLPDKSQGHYTRNLRFQIFVIYRRLFGIVFVTNMGVFIATAVKGGYNAESLGLIVVANIFVAVLMRQEHIVNAFFAVFCCIPPSWAMFTLTDEPDRDLTLIEGGHYLYDAPVPEFIASEEVSPANVPGTLI